MQPLIKTRVILFGITFSFQTLFTQNPQLNFDHFITGQGLSQSTVDCIFQDHYGFIWFGIDNDLIRYDRFCTLYNFLKNYL